MTARKKTLLSIAAAITILSVTAGVFLWQKHKSPELVAINVPRKVCGGALSGPAVAPLFPGTAKSRFTDYADAPFALTLSDACMMKAGERAAELRLYTHYDSTAAGWAAREHTWDDDPGYVKISLGAAVGHAGNSFAQLNWDCKSYLHGSFVMSIWVNYYAMKGGDVPKGKRGSFVALAGEALRYSAGEKGLRCKGAAELPRSAPAIG